jgi:hypothetical protein
VGNDEVISASTSASMKFMNVTSTCVEHATSEQVSVRGPTRRWQLDASGAAGCCLEVLAIARAAVLTQPQMTVTGPPYAKV